MITWSWDGRADAPTGQELKRAADAESARHPHGSERWAAPLAWAALWTAADLAAEDRDWEAMLALEALQTGAPSVAASCELLTRIEIYQQTGHHADAANVPEQALAAYGRAISLIEANFSRSWTTPKSMAYSARILSREGRVDLAMRTAEGALSYLRDKLGKEAGVPTTSVVLDALVFVSARAEDPVAADFYVALRAQLDEDPDAVMAPQGVGLHALPPLAEILPQLDSARRGTLERWLRQVAALCVTEPDDSLWHAARALLEAHRTVDPHTRLAHLLVAVKKAWVSKASPLLARIALEGAEAAANVEAWAEQEAFLADQLKVAEALHGEHSAPHLWARTEIAVCAVRRADARTCRQELQRLRKLVLTRFPDDTDLLGRLHHELTQLAGSEGEDPLATLDRRAALEGALTELDAMVGLGEVKAHIRRLVDFLAISRQRERAGLPRVQRGFHFAFLGPPGTGKTTVARLLGRIFWALELLPTDNVTEASRVDLVGGYIGQTAIKTQELVVKAMDGVLFVDEAYSLQSISGNDFGLEAVAELVKVMENERDRIIVVLAGYTGEMQQMLEMNPGLASRVNEVLEFPGYSDRELERAFGALCVRQGYELSAEARRAVPGVIAGKRRDAGKSFGNAREIRNLFEDAVVLHASRLGGDAEGDPAALRLLEASDLGGQAMVRPSARRIGFGA